MTLDLGFTGLGLLIVLSLGFGAAAHLLTGRDTRWRWLIAATGWFVGGLVASEVLWGKLTVDDIQPIIDGLALDESLLGGLIGGLVGVLLMRSMAGRDRSMPGMSPRP